ncbi:MAG TPA: gluconate 2-dehydrogenase subunit 3 family protein [Opitutaceae bacterium]|nr:gluconate 2-dehydrogenase subunit 3 family protein [Opitutaceae bacterium]
MKPIDPAPGEQTALSRRAVLKIGMVGIIGAAVGTGSTAAFARLVRSPRPKYRFFSDEEAALLIDICEQIIPRDDVAGATDTGAINYIDRQLCGVFARHQQAYRRGLESFGRTCLKQYKAPFQDLSAPVKIEALRAIESGVAPTELWGDPSPRAFFNLVLAHTMQSFYGSPRHGGNRDYASYRMLGLDYPQLVGQNRYAKA